ncbi:MAG TPA: hypothetical protein VGN07_00860 [Steroidobacteraceae bacterium]
MELREGSFDFPSIKGSGPQALTSNPTVRFPRNVIAATAALTGYSAGFDRSDGDHHFGRFQIELSATVNPADPREVVVDALFGVRDWSGSWDDEYVGNAQYVVIAELEPIAPGGPTRGDLIIADAEFTQAIQHFRSYKHLPASQAEPDNSMRLVTGKDTVVRVYADYDASSGLPVIATLSGQMRVTAGGTTQTILPLNPITPRRDNQVERSQFGQTLNFLIPEALCRGTVSVEAEVFQSGDMTQISETFHRTLTFFDVPPLSIFAVGINYTGPDRKAGVPEGSPQLAAPQQSDFATLFAFTERLYPIPSVAQTGFMTIDYDAEVKSDITKGCDKFEDLRDTIKDLVGDSSDIFYGLLNTGVETGSLGGCGGDGNACVGIIGADRTAAHELGHVLGRQHAPCDNVTRCARPLNTDDDYPQYGSFDSDSIGEFGVDSVTLAVRDPGEVHDIMGYSGNKWISPYTYSALLSRVPLPDDTSVSPSIAFAARRAQDDEWLRRKQEHLFLSISIDRQRHVTWRPAFHYPTRLQGHGTKRTAFAIEFLDAKGQTLHQSCLYTGGSSCGCSSGPECQTWPMRISQAVPYVPGARKLVIYEHDKVIYSHDIGEPPQCKLSVDVAADSKKPALTAHFGLLGAATTDNANVWFLLQWQDGSGVWRSVAPRTRDDHLTVALSLFGRRRIAPLRLLATNAVATSITEWTNDGSRPTAYRRANRDVTLVATTAASDPQTPVSVPQVLRIHAHDADGRSVPAPQIRWYGDGSTEIGRGRSFDLAQLPYGQQVLRAVALDSGYGRGSQQWVVERRRDGSFTLKLGPVTHTRRYRKRHRP